MKITFVLPYASVAGGVRVAAIYARELQARGHEVTVISQARRRRPWYKALLRKVRGQPGGKTGRGKPPTRQLDFLGPRHIVISHPLPLRAEEVPDADVIIATWWETAFAVSALRPEKGEKFYFIQHHEVHGHLRGHLSAGSYHLPMHKITISQWLVDTMRNTYGDGDVDLVENSVDLEMFNAPDRGRQVQPTVGLLYAKNPFKGVDISLKAIEKAQERVPNLKVIAFGAGDLRPDLPLPDNSEYHKSPDQARLREIYASCDVWLCGSRAEGFHLPPSEAMACRCPVVSTAIGGSVEIVTEGVNGHIVPVEDHNALGDRLADVLTLPEEQWHAMSEAAYARARSYSWADATAKFEGYLMAKSGLRSQQKMQKK